MENINQNNCSHEWIEDDIRGGNGVLECFKCGKTRKGLLSEIYKTNPMEKQKECEFRSPYITITCGCGNKHAFYVKNGEIHIESEGKHQLKESIINTDMFHPDIPIDQPKEAKEESWKEEFDKEFLSDGVVKSYPTLPKGRWLHTAGVEDVKSFIETLLLKEREKIKEWAEINSHEYSRKDKRKFIDKTDLVNYLETYK